MLWGQIRVLWEQISEGTECSQGELETLPYPGDSLRPKGQEPGLLAAASWDIVMERGHRTAELEVTVSGRLDGAGQEMVGVAQALAVARSL